MRARVLTAGLGLGLITLASPASAQGPGWYGTAPGHDYRYDSSRAMPAQGGFPVDPRLAERCGLGPGSSRPYDDVPLAAYGDECAAVLPPGYMLVSVPGNRPECYETVTSHDEWVPETVTLPAQRAPRRAPPLRDKRTKLQRVK